MEITFLCRFALDLEICKVVLIIHRKKFSRVDLQKKTTRNIKLNSPVEFLTVLTFTLPTH